MRHILPWTPYFALIHIYHSSLHLCLLALADSHGASLCLCLPDTGELCIPLKLRQSIDWLAERNYALRPLAYNKFQNLTIQPWLACNFICRSDWLELGDLTASASWVLQGKTCWAVHPHARPKQRHFTAGSDSKHTSNSKLSCVINKDSMAVQQNAPPELNSPHIQTQSDSQGDVLRRLRYLLNNGHCKRKPQEVADWVAGPVCGNQLMSPTLQVIKNGDTVKPGITSLISCSLGNHF